jgi:hypothetical protein
MDSPISTDIGQIFIPVRDIKASATWYGALLGFPHDDAALSHGETICDIPTAGSPRGMSRQSLSGFPVGTTCQ